MCMEILVDYDNLDSQVTRNGVWPLCTRISTVIASKRETAPERCRVRLYGGWYDGSQLTRLAQRLGADINREFPGTMKWQSGGKVTSCLTQAELAVSLQVEPRRHLFHTFRTRTFCAQLICQSEVFDDCREDWCPMREVEAFLRERRCPGSNCTVRQEDVLRRGEQKLIDTMITSDLIFLTTQGQKDLVVVSSDDDIWPGIRTAVELGARVTVVHTGRRALPADYSIGVRGIEQLFM